MFFEWSLQHQEDPNEFVLLSRLFFNDDAAGPHVNSDPTSSRSLDDAAPC